MHKAKVQIVIVEDGEEDFDLLRHAFDRAEILVPLIRCRNGREATVFFSGEKSASTPVATIVFMDLNLPDVDGRDLLLQLRATPTARHVPIIILSTSNNPQDVALCYARGANGYVVKPVGMAGLKNMIIAFKNFWLDTVELPL